MPSGTPPECEFHSEGRAKVQAVPETGSDSRHAARSRTVPVSRSMSERTIPSGGTNSFGQLPSRLRLRSATFCLSSREAVRADPRAWSARRIEVRYGGAQRGLSGTGSPRVRLRRPRSG